jgi:hypothetical protein
MEMFLFSEEIIRPCRVDLNKSATKEALLSKSQLAASTNKREVKQHGFCRTVKADGQMDKKCNSFYETEPVKSQADAKKVHQCLLCNAAFSSTYQQMTNHMRKHHSGQFVQCKFNGECAQVFLKEEQRMEHMLRDHKLAAKKKCDFCDNYITLLSMNFHIRQYHKKDNLVRCSYRGCSAYFRSEEEKQKHEELKHGAANKEKCIICGLVVSHKYMKVHLRVVHKDQLPSAFKCTFSCSAYFRTESERNKHNDSFHQCVVRKEVKCIYCNKLCVDKRVLAKHVEKCRPAIKLKYRAKFMDADSIFVLKLS